MAATNLGQLSVDIIANIGNLQRGLSNASKIINQFAQRTSKQVQTGTKFMGSQYNKFAVTVQKTGEAVKKTQTPLVNAINQTTKAVQRNTQVLSRTFSTIKKGGATVDRASKKLQHFGKGFGDIGKRMSSFIRFNIAWFATWRLMWGALRAIKAGVAAIVEFDTAMTNLGAITGATQEQLMKLEDTAREVGATTRFTAVETANAMVDLSKAGFSVSEVNEMIAGTAKLAIGTLSELSQTTQLVATTLRTFSLQAADATEVANIFAAAITNSRLTIEGLRNSMKYIGPIMAEIGYTLMDTSAVLGVLADRGLEAGISARGLRGFFSALIAPSAKLRKEIERVGLTMADISPLTNDLGDILFRLREAGFDVESAMRGLERRVGTTAIALIGAGKYFDILRDAITGTTAAEVISERQTGSLGYRIKLIKSEATELALAFRDLLLPGIVGVMGAISSLLVIFGDFFEIVNAINDILPEFVRNMLSLATATGETKEAMGGILALLPWLYTRFKGAKDELTNFRKEIAVSVFNLNKQLVQLVRTAVALEQYKDDEVKLRIELRALADLYPEITTLLSRTNVTYEHSIALVEELIEAKREEIKVRDVEHIAAIKAELSMYRQEAKELEILQEKIANAGSAMKIIYQGQLVLKEVWFYSYDAIIGKIRELEATLRILTRTEEEQVEVEIDHGEGLVKSAKDELDLAKKRKASIKELLPLYNEVIKLQQEESAVLLDNIDKQWRLVEKREKQELQWINVMADPTVEEAYKSWIKSEKILTGLIQEKRDILDELRDNLDELVADEDKYLDIIEKRSRTEIKYYKTRLQMTALEMKQIKDVADLTGEWEYEKAKQYIKLQGETYETFTKFLDARLQYSLSTGKKEYEVIRETQELFKKWGPLFNEVASQGFQASSTWTEAWAEEFKTLTEHLFVPDVEAEKARIKKAYQEYNDLMLEQQIAFGTASRQELIDRMTERLADTKFWEDKEYATRMAYEKKLVSLYQATNKEIIKDAKKLAKADLSLAADVLLQRLDYLETQAAAYPILAQSIKDALEELGPDVVKLLKKTEDEITELFANTVEKRVALAGKEYQDKIDEIKIYLKVLDKTEKESVEIVQASEVKRTKVYWHGMIKRLEIEEIYIEKDIKMSEKRADALLLIDNYILLRDKAMTEETTKTWREYNEDYFSILEGRLDKVNIKSKQSYDEAMKNEKDRYDEATRGLNKNLDEHERSMENRNILSWKLDTIHTENKEKITTAYYLWESQFIADSVEKERQAVADSRILALKDAGQFRASDLAQAKEDQKRAQVAMEKDFVERLKEIDQFGEAYNQLLAQREEAGKLIISKYQADVATIEETYAEQRKALLIAQRDFRIKTGLDTTENLVKLLELELDTELQALKILKEEGKDTIEADEKVIESKEKLYGAVVIYTDKLIDLVKDLGVHERRTALMILDTWDKTLKERFPHYTLLLERIEKANEEFAGEYQEFLINMLKAEIDMEEARGAEVLKRRIALAREKLKNADKESEDYAKILVEIALAERALTDYQKQQAEDLFQFRRKIGEKTIHDEIERTKELIGLSMKTILAAQQEIEFQADYAIWAKALGLSPDPDDIRHYYDYRGFWEAWKQGFIDMGIDPETGEVHFPDEWKLPLHPTFPIEMGIDIEKMSPEQLKLLVQLYGQLVDMENKLIAKAVERGEMNAEIKDQFVATWWDFYRSITKTDEEATELIEEHWTELAKSMGLISETIEGRWDLLVKRLTNRLNQWFRDSKGYLNDWALFVTEMFKFTIDKLANAFAELFQFIWEGQERIAMLERDRMADRLSDIERMLEREIEAHGKFTDRYKELLEMRGEAEKDLADSEFDLLKQRTAWWRNFINAIIAEIGRLIAYLIAKAIVIQILKWLGIPAGGLKFGGQVGAKGGIGVGGVASLKKGGLVPSIGRSLQSLQRGGEVIVAAHPGEYYIPAPLVKQIKRTQEIPETLTEAIVAGKPPSFQRGGEVGGNGEGVGGNLIVHFHPGTQFTEENKVKTRMWFEETILPLYREAERRE